MHGGGLHWDSAVRMQRDRTSGRYFNPWIRTDARLRRRMHIKEGRYNGIEVATGGAGPGRAGRCMAETDDNRVREAP